MLSFEAMKPERTSKNMPQTGLSIRDILQPVTWQTVPIPPTPSFHLTF
jgi:hypothetical protein